MKWWDWRSGRFSAPVSERMRRSPALFWPGPQTVSQRECNFQYDIGTVFVPVRRTPWLVLFGVQSLGRRWESAGPTRWPFFNSDQRLDRMVIHASALPFTLSSKGSTPVRYSRPASSSRISPGLAESIFAWMSCQEPGGTGMMDARRMGNIIIGHTSKGGIPRG